MTTSTVCHCGHPKVWHVRPTNTNDRWGACQITGPQSGDGCDCTQFRPKASPNVQVRLTRKQAEVALSSVRWTAEGKAKSNPLWAVVRQLEVALDENTGEPGG